jgi:heme A synthase
MGSGHSFSLAVNSSAPFGSCPPIAPVFARLPCFGLVVFDLSPERSQMVKRCNNEGIQMSGLEWFERFFGILSLISVALSVYLWHRATKVPSFPDQPSLTLSWRSRLHARAGFAAAFALFFQSLLMIFQAIEAVS